MANKAIDERALELSQCTILYCNNNEHTQLAVTLETSETTVISTWVIPPEINDETVIQVFSKYGTVSRVTKLYYLINSLLFNLYTGKRLIHFLI